MRAYYLLISFCFIFALQAAQVRYAPKNTVIAFDLHGVLFKSNCWNMALGAAKLLYNGMWRFVFNKKIVMQVRELAKTGMPEEAIFNTLVQEYPELLRYKADFIVLSNEQYVMPKVEALVKKLKAAGYKLYVLTNLGGQAYEHLAKKYSSVLSLFDGAYMPSFANNYSYKPQKEFFEYFKDYLFTQGDNDKYIIFIDDTQKNIQAAHMAGIASIKFTSAKQLARCLSCLEII